MTGPRQTTMRRQILPLAAALLIGTVQTRAQPDAGALDRAIAGAYASAYNLDQDAAYEAARQAVAIAPGESRAHRTLAAITWLDILFQRGALTVDNYLGGITRSEQKVPKPPADLDAACRAEIQQAIDLAQSAVTARPDDVEARYDLGSAWALQASYTASVEGRMSSAFLAARRAFDAQESVLDDDPARVAAGVVVGTYRYVVSGLALPSRWFAYIAGMGGGKEKGIALLEAATRDPRARVDAQTALVLIYSREGRHDDALRVLRELASAYPRNRLFVLEQGAAAIRAGHAAEAEAVLSRGLGMLAREDRRTFPGERALWLYKRGLARLNENHRDESLADLNAALAAAPQPWVRGRILLARGKVQDLNGRRADALADYRVARELAERANDPACEKEAGRWLDRPFTFPARHG